MLPAPYSHIAGSPVLSQKWGQGWLGSTMVGGTTRFWFVDRTLDSSIEIDHDRIYLWTDDVYDEVWLIFGSEDDVLAFLVDPPEVESVPLPRRLKRFLGV